MTGVVVLTPLVVAAVVGLVLLVLWLREPSAARYARTHVQALFVSDSLKPTGTVKRCQKVGPGAEAGDEIWTCTVAGKGCLRVFSFAIDREYGTVPYDNRSADGTTDPCQVTTNPTHGTSGRVPLHPIASTIPELHDAVALGTLVALDPRSDVAEFRIRCGWYAARGKPTDPEATMPKRRLHPGLWKVALRKFAFTFETYPNGPASGIAHEATLNAWERYVAPIGWTGTLFLPFGWNEPFLSDAPTTDICRGILG
jgi:hypothetical protein